MYKDPDEKMLEQVRKSLELIETGSYNPEAPKKEGEGEKKLESEAKPTEEKPTEEKPAETTATEKPAEQQKPAEEKPAETKSASAPSDDALMKELGLA